MKLSRILTLCLFSVASIAMSVAATLTANFTQPNPVAPEGVISVNGPKDKDYSADLGVKLGSDGNYVQWVLETSTFTAATFDGYINTTNTSNKNWAFQFSTDKGATWSSEVTQSNDGNKTIHTMQVEASIPSGANGIRIVRRAGTSTYVKSIALTTDGAGGSGDQKSNDATLSTLLVLDKSVPGFTSNQFTYSIRLSKLEVATLAATQNVKYTTSNPNATVTYTYVTPDDNTCIVTIIVTAEDGITVNNYVINVTVTDGTDPLSSDATLSDLKLNGNTIQGFSPSVTRYNVKIKETDPCVITYTTNDPKATAKLGYSIMSTGDTLYDVTVIAEDQTFLSYFIEVVREKTVIIDPVDVPTTDLTCHRPEVYEGLKMFGGYGGTLTVMNNREYEVYYLARYKVDGSTNSVTVSVDPVVAGNTIISTNETPNSFDSKDGWFVGRSSTTHSSSSDTNKREEFEAAPIKYKMKNGDSISMHVSGYDQFRFLAKDKKVDTKKPENNSVFEVYIDGVQQPAQYNASSITVRSYDMTAGEHVITIKATGTGDSEASGWSLRLTNEPMVKYLSGNDSSQVVNQTQSINPIKYAIKHYAGSNLSWVGSSVAGVQLTSLNSLGDTLQVAGVANAPVGTYTYKVEALNANGNVATTINGTFKIKTEIVADSTDAVVWINDPMEFNFTFYALDAGGIHFSWTGATPSGLTASAGANQTYSIKGTPTKEGTYPYSISIDGGNTLTGTITVDIPSPAFIPPVPAEAHVKAGVQMNNIVWGVKFASAATISGLPSGVNGSYSNGQLIISGTPTALNSYPQTFTYTITATPEYTGKASSTVTGQIVVIDPNAKSLLYLYKDNYNDAVYNYLNGRYDVLARSTENQMRSTNDYAYYNAVVISENVDANNGEVLDIITKLNKPILNMKSFTYTSSRLGWGNPDNGSISNLSVYVVQPTHPIFGEYMSNESFTVPILSDLDLRGIQPVDVTLQNSLCIAVAPIRGRDYDTDGEYQTAIHEVPGNLRGAGITARYILLPISQRSAKYINSAARRLIDATISYLTDNSTGYSIKLPELKITQFQIEGIDATIDQANKTITCSVPDYVDLASATPYVALADDATHVLFTDSKHNKPTVYEYGSVVDLSDSHFGNTFIVSDYINKVTYNVNIRQNTTKLENEGLTGVYYDSFSQTLVNNEGRMLYVYDVMGKMVVVANSTISLSQLPSGIYLIQGADGSMKIIK